MPIRWRTESFSNSGARDINDVVEYEMFELSNSDIPCYMLEHYADIIEHLGYADIFRFYADFNWEYQSPDEWFEQKYEMLQAITDTIDAVAGRHIPFALWLGDKEAVIQRYSSGHGDVLDGYNTDGTYKLSDLGHDGALYGFTEKPIPETSEEVLYSMVQEVENEERF